MTVEDRVQRIIHDIRGNTHFAADLAPAQTLLERMKVYHTPGMSVAVIHNFELDWTRGFGINESGLDRQVTTDTVFQAGSISKPITALAAMRLVQQGILNLDEEADFLQWV